MLRAMSETSIARISTIISQMATLSGRIDAVEKGPRPSSQTSTPTLEPQSTLWCNRLLDKPLVEEDNCFTMGALYLFGKDFKKSAKEHDSVQKKISQLQELSYSENQKFFQQRCHHNQAARGGGAF